MKKNGKNKSLILFTENHWQTSYTVMIYLNYLREKLYYNKEKLGIVWDKASMHISKDVMEHIDKCNNDNTSYPRLIVECVDEGLTSIYQPPDVVINRPLKVEIRRKYYQLLTSGNNFQPGQHVLISREDLVK